MLALVSVVELNHLKELFCQRAVVTAIPVSVLESDRCGRGAVILAGFPHRSPK